MLTGFDSRQATLLEQVYVGGDLRDSRNCCSGWLRQGLSDGALEQIKMITRLLGPRRHGLAAKSPSQAGRVGWAKFLGEVAILQCGDKNQSVAICFTEAKAVPHPMLHRTSLSVMTCLVFVDP